MKKLIVAAAIICAAVVSQAACAVGWSGSNATAYNGDQYMLFVIGQNGVDKIATITALLDEGSDVSSYAFASGTVASGKTTVTSANSGKTIGTGNWTSFEVIFDSATPTAGASKYCVVSGVSGQTKLVEAETAAITFGAGNLSTFTGDPDNWKSYGESPTPPPGPTPDTPEPTSGLLLLLGVAGLALKRKHA